MKNSMWAAAFLALLMMTPLAMAEETPALLGVQITPTVRPTATPSPSAAPPEATPGEATPGEAWMADITQAEMDAAGLGERILMRGSEGEDVLIVQRRLAQLGYYLGELDGIFGLGTRSAVYEFQSAHKLTKIDGKVGPETIGRLFGEDVILKPTPTPIPTPVVTPTPDIASAPFAMEELTVQLGTQRAALFLGRDGQGELLYPLCGVSAWFDYESTYAAGSWQLLREADGREIALMTDGQDGLCEAAMGSADGTIYLADAQNTVYVYSGEAYLNAAMLYNLGFTVTLNGELPVIQEAE